MLPILFHIGPLPIYGYGLALAVGFMTGILLAQHDAKYFNIPEKKLESLFPSIIIFGAFGARLFHAVIERPGYFMRHPLDFFKLWDGGVTFYGGLIFSILAAWYFAKKNKINFLNLIDFLIPYVALGQVFGRIGCFLAGCCYGLPTDLPWGIAVTNPLSATTPLGVPLHPTQLYQVLWNLLTFIILYRTSFRKKFVGQSLLLYGIIYPIGRIIIEIFRGDSIRGFIIDGVLSTSQGLSLVILTVSIILYIRMHRKVSIHNPVKKNKK
jgi:phosphatidylglycerol---prolipoprotein diacylglyceryl transferase